VYPKRTVEERVPSFASELTVEIAFVIPAAMVKIDSQAKRDAEAGVHELSQRSTSVDPVEAGVTVALAVGAVMPQFIREVPS
jgi:hypothetical protein